jgi:hypothetical protein
MRHKNRIGIVALLGTLAACGALAVEVAPSFRQPARQVGQPQASVQADDSQALRRGLITAVGANGDRVQIQGRWHRIESGRTRLFRDGRPVPADVLRQGQVLAFTLVPGAEQAPTLGAVYVP